MGRKRGSASVKDVARAAGVSVGTVSNVLNRPQTVAQDTRARVQAAIEDLRFVRNEAARHLRSGASRAIGLVVLDAANPFFATLMRGAEDLVGEHGDVVLLGNSAGMSDREHHYLTLFEQQRVRGVLIAPTRELPDLSGLERLGIPVVYLDRHLPGSTYSSVSVDDVEGGRIAARHLLDLGHRDVVFAGGPTALQQVHDRFLGFREVTEHGGGRVRQMLTEGLAVADGRVVGAQLARGLPDGPTAVFATNDLIAIGVLNELLSRGFAVPADVAIVGFDDIEFAATTTVPLTTINQPAYELGREAAVLLYQELDVAPDPYPGQRHASRQVRFTPSLVVRESTGAPRSRHGM